MMRKLMIFSLILLLVLGLALSGCKAQQIKPKAKAANGSAEQPSVEIKPAEPVDVTKTISETAKTDADLQLDSLYWSTIYPERGVPVDLKMTVANIGTEAVSGFPYNLKIFKDGNVWKEENYVYEAEISSNSSTKIIKKYTFNEGGKYKAEAYIDIENSLGERKRLNNAKISSELNVITAVSNSSSGSSSGSGSGSSSGSCVDTDDGVDELTKGKCDDGVSVFGIDDYCKTSSTLVEFSCGTDGLCTTEDIDCDRGCESGACQS